jgi:hypothetical protein
MKGEQKLLFIMFFSFSLRWKFLLRRGRSERPVVRMLVFVALSAAWRCRMTPSNTQCLETKGVLSSLEVKKTHAQQAVWLFVVHISAWHMRADWGFHGGKRLYCGLLGCDTVVTEVLRNIPPSYSVCVRRGWLIRTPDSYLEGPGFHYCLEAGWRDWGFMFFLAPFTQS